MSTPDYYEILGVDRNADASTIKKAFRQKARTAHPDAGGDEEEFKKLSEAYEVLSDPEKKKVYDNFGSTGPYIPPDGNYSTSTRYTTNFSGINWEDILNNMRGGSWSTNTSTTGFSFDDLFGANRQDRSTTQAQSTVSLDVETNLNVSLADTVNGGKKRISVHIDGKKKTFDINVPKQHGAEPTIRLAGQGRTNSQGITGDLFIHIHTEIPDGYTIEGKNIVGTIDIPFPVAVCGGKVQATLPSGKEVKVKVPPHTDSNKTFSFSKEGIEEGGKTVLATRITIPDNLTPREVLQIKKMKDEHDL